jgi:glycine betaine/proline transport system permease protein
MTQVRAFVGSNSGYYETQFSRLERAVHFRWTINAAAALLGPMWLASRRLWDWALAFLVIELIATSLLATATYGPLGQTEIAQADRLAKFAASRAIEAEEAKKSNSANAETLETSAQALKSAA